MQFLFSFLLLRDRLQPTSVAAMKLHGCVLVVLASAAAYGEDFRSERSAAGEDAQSACPAKGSALLQAPLQPDPGGDETTFLQAVFGQDSSVSGRVEDEQHDGKSDRGPGSALSCHGVPPWGSAYDDWCNQNCNHVPSYCPASHCDCSGPSPQPTRPPTQPTPPVAAPHRRRRGRPDRPTPPTPPPTQPTLPPTQPTLPPTQPTLPPTQPTSPPTQPTLPPTQPTPPPTQPTPPPTQPTQLPTQPPPDGNAHDHFPYDDGNIILASDDGFPDYDLNGANNASNCRTDWRVECTGDIRCKCGEPESPRRDGCFTCLHLNYDLPMNKLSEIYNWNPMTRSQIIERALGWVVSGWTYGDHEGSIAPGAPEGCASDDDGCPRYSYGSGVKARAAVCQDLVKMAWGSNRYPYKGIPIDCANMLPGDVIHQRHIRVDGGTVHFQLFRRWLDASDTSEGAPWLVYQMGGGWFKSNAAVTKYNSTSDACYRRPNLVEENAEVVLHWSVSESCSSIGCRQASDFDECSAWASRVLGHAEIASASVPEQDGVPGGCYISGWKEDMSNSVYFNDGSWTESECSRNRPCVCECPRA